jgi:hypothetical protein
MNNGKDYSDEDKQASKDFGDTGINYGNEISLAYDYNCRKIEADAEAETALAEFEAEMRYVQRGIVRKNNAAVMFVKDNISYDFDLIELDDLDWQHIGYVEVEETDEKESGYSDYKFYYEKGDRKLKYMRQDDEGDYHNLVWQTVGYLGDDYSGYLLFPLKDGRYWKILYSC